jgi:tRNA pseudouridine55 synthase
MDGIVVLDKPRGISSHDAVQKLRRLIGIKRIGHLGTLDPIGTGVLPLVIGRATRLSQFFLGHDRAYEAVIRFGFATDTYDACGEPAAEPQPVALTRDQIEAILPNFRGELHQTPPPISAKKIDGVPAYKLARKKQPVDLDPVTVNVYELDLREINGDRARVFVRCSAGTYVRSLAHEIGQAVGAGAHIEELRRTAMGEFALEMAHTLEDLAALQAAGRFSEALLAPEKVLPEIPAEHVDQVTATQILHGRDFRVSPFSSRKGAKRIKAIDPEGHLVAIAEARLPLIYHPIVVL